jgi:hypothetical protein
MIHPALALRPLRSILLPLLDYPTFLMKRRTPYGSVMVVARIHEVMTHVTKS